MIMHEENEIGNVYITEVNVTSPHNTPIVLVHGAFHGSWVWRNMMAYFAHDKWHSIAVDLRGHHRKTRLSRSEIIQTGIMDYVADVDNALKYMEIQNPILIGHSMGGLISAKIAESYELKALILIAPSPPAGVKSGLSIGSIDVDKPLVLEDSKMEELYLKQVPREEKADYKSLFVPASPRAITEIADGLISVEKSKISCPVLVINGMLDPQHNKGEDLRVAEYFDAPCISFPGMGHDMMIETRWSRVAHMISLWLQYVVCKNN